MADEENSMRLVDLTLPVPDATGSAHLEEWPLTLTDGSRYTGMVYNFTHNSMVGSYIDFPGHLKETADGLDAERYPVEKLFRVPSTVIHLDRGHGSGAVSAGELQAACPKAPHGSGLVINALGKRRFDEIEERSVWLAPDAVQWIVGTGIHLLVSDIYESRGLHGVFAALFRAGISTVCYPIHLDRLVTPRVRITCLVARFSGVTQLPCRIVAEL